MSPSKIIMDREKEFSEIYKNPKKILENKYRSKILSLCNKKPYTITELEKELNLKHGIVHYHLQILELFDLITTKKEKKQQGQPVKITTNKEVWLNFRKKNKEDSTELLEDVMIKKVLEGLKRCDSVHRCDFVEMLVLEYGLSFREASDFLESLENDGLINDIMKITKAGEEEIKEIVEELKEKAKKK